MKNDRFPWNFWHLLLVLSFPDVARLTPVKIHRYLAPLSSSFTASFRRARDRSSTLRRCETSFQLGNQVDQSWRSPLYRNYIRGSVRLNLQIYAEQNSLCTIFRTTLQYMSLVHISFIPRSGLCVSGDLPLLLTTICLVNIHSTCAI